MFKNNEAIQMLVSACPGSSLRKQGCRQSFFIIIEKGLDSRLRGNDILKDKKIKNIKLLKIILQLFITTYSSE